jgi:iron complex transport system ATP-binding protein
MGNLLKQGYRVTAGIINTLDTDYEVATHLNIPVVTDPPFSPASEEAHETNLEFVERADVVVLTDTPIGWGNIKNLDAAKRALERKIPLVMIEKTPFKKRDFTGGEARRRLCDLKKMGARCVGDLKEFFSALDLIRKSKSSIDR